MPYRTTPLVTGEYYHVYNRGVARQPVFLTKRDYKHFLLTLSYYRFSNPPLKLSHFLQQSREDQVRLMKQVHKAGKKLVELISLVLMPNHFHLLVRQTADEGISTFLRRATNSYTRYFNTTHDRVGPVFQGPFKTVRVETDEQLIHLSRYIHLNPLMGHVVKASTWRSYPWSSFPDFQQGTSAWLDLRPVLCRFASPKAHEQFVQDQVASAKVLKRIAHLVLE